MTVDLKKIKKAHFVGVGGVGMSALAAFFAHRKIKVTGSDLKENENIIRLRKLGIDIFCGDHISGNFPKDAQLLIFSSAVPFTNPERLAAEKKGVPQLDYHVALGILTSESDACIVTGSHGKTTTTAMLGSILAKSHNASILVGSNCALFDGNFRLGSKDTFVVEGDEYQKGILELNPHLALINNMEWDHPDTYPTEQDYFETFNDFIRKIPDDGFYIYNADDHNINSHLEKPSCHSASFGINNTHADLVAKNIKNAHGRQIFKFVYKGNELKDFNLKIPGIHNIYNALGASLAALEMGVNQDVIKDALATFPGTQRRFELVGESNGAIVISDYAHHPTELASTLSAAKTFYPDKNLIVYFQPHHKKRTQALYKDFAKILDSSGYKNIFINEIYDVPGRSDEIKISSKDIIKTMKTKATFVSSLDEGEELMRKKLGSKDVLLVIGAGDIDKVSRNLVK